MDHGDVPSLQLTQDIRDAITRALSTRRPLLHHLNADTSWLLQLPRPPSAVKRGGRIYYNILIDPWFTGGQSDVASWFSQQWHAVDSAVKSLEEVEKLIREMEVLAGGLRLGRGRSWNKDQEAAREETFIDCIAISHEFTDHCHKETLMEAHRDVPVVATQKAASLISSWSHFRTVLEALPFPQNTDWHTTSQPPLPDWLSITRLVAPSDALYYHSALLITFSSHPPTAPRKSWSHTDSTWDLPADPAEALIYTPHGIPPSALTPLESASPSIKVLAFLHGLHDVSIPWTGPFGVTQQLNLGAHNALKAQRILNAKYWVGTHDEVKKGGGLVSWLLKREVISVEEALKAEDKEDHKAKKRTLNGEAKGGGMVNGRIKGKGDFKDVAFENVGNGESRVLE